MPEHLRALVVILFLSFIGFALARKVLQSQINEKEFNLWRNTWFVTSAVAFISGNFWIYAIFSGFYVSFICKKIDTKIAIFFVFLLVIPPVGQPVSGFGLISYLVRIDQLRLATLIVLLPVAIKLYSTNKFKFFKTNTDICILIYILIMIVLEFRDTTFTDALRKSFYTFIDILLPYYVASRSIKNINQLKTVSLAIITVAIVIAMIALFEHLKGWLLYRSLHGILDHQLSNQVLARSGYVRSIASLLQPIVLGYFMCIALGLYLFISHYITKINYKRIGFFILLAGLYAPVSRGPWVGAFLIYLVFLSLGPSAIKKISTVALCSALILPSLYILPGGEKYLNLIPFLGDTEKTTITYRQDLYKNSVKVIERNPLFGSSNYILAPEMQALKINGIIDIVNTFIQVALETGLVGLLFFAGAFLAAMTKSYGLIRKVQDKNNEYSILLRSMIGILIGIIVTISTVSSIGAVALLYWLVLGLCVAANEITKNMLAERKALSII